MIKKKTIKKAPLKKVVKKVERRQEHELFTVDLPVTVPLEDRLAHGVSQSELTTYLTCRAKKKLTQEGWTPLGIRTPLAFGTLGHGALEHMFTKYCKMGVDERRKILKNETCTKAEVKKYLATVLDKLVETGVAVKTIEQYEFWCTQLEVLLPAYYSFWSESTDEWNLLSVERKIPHVKFAGTTLEGTMDNLFEFGDGVAVMDHKFKGQIVDETILRVLDSDFQMLYYGLCVDLEFGSLPKKAVYNCIRRPGLRLGAVETLPAYRDRLREHIYKDPDHYFKRYNIPYNIPTMRRFAADLQEIVGEYLQWQKDGCPVRRYGNPCDGKYGVCEFYDMCHYNNHFLYRQEVAGGYRPIMKATAVTGSGVSIETETTNKLFNAAAVEKTTTAKNARKAVKPAVKKTNKLQKGKLVTKRVSVKHT